MIILQRHIWRSVMLPCLAVLGVLMLLDALFSFVYELDSLRNDYQVWQAFQFVITTLPRRLAEFLPMAILLGTLVGLGLLANHGELTVMRAAGVSSGRIGWMALRPTLVLLVAGMLVAEYVSPYTEQVARSNKAMAESGGIGLASMSGLWHREGDEFIHISAVEPQGVLHGITRYRLGDDYRLVETQYIRRATFVGPEWRTEDLRGSILTDERVETWRAETGEWLVRLTPDLLSVIILKPEHLAISRLFEYASYLEAQGLNASEYMLVFWQKLAQPLAVLGMVMIAVSFIFGPLRQVSVGLRLTAGIMAGMVFHYGQQFFGQMSLVFNLSPLWAAFLPAGLCLFAGVVLLGRVR